MIRRPFELNYGDTQHNVNGDGIGHGDGAYCAQSGGAFRYAECAPCWNFRDVRTEYEDVATSG